MAPLLLTITFAVCAGMWLVCSPLLFLLEGSGTGGAEARAAYDVLTLVTVALGLAAGGRWAWSKLESGSSGHKHASRRSRQSSSRRRTSSLGAG